jgi:hypothetical protein
MSSGKGNNISQLIKDGINVLPSNFIIGTASPKGAEEKDIKQARRRLSVMSDNKLVEGFDSVNLDGDEEVIFVIIHSSLAVLM